jgi:hypothetical protein
VTPLLAVYVAAVVTTLTVLGWAVAADWWRTPRWAGSSWTRNMFAALAVSPAARERDAQGSDSAPDPCAESKDRP